MASYKSTRAYDTVEPSTKQTNRLLNSIENKLSDFFSGDPRNLMSPKDLKDSISKEQHNPLMYRSRSNLEKDENLHLSGLGYTSPLAEKDLSNYLSPSDDQRYARINPNSSQRRLQFQENVRPLASIENLPNRDYREYMEYGVDIDRMRRVDNGLGGSENWKRQVTEPTPGISGHGLIEKMNKIEETYQGKIQILEERLHGSEYDNEVLRKQYDKLEQEAYRLRKENNELQIRLEREQRRTQEDREEAGGGRFQVENERLRARLEEMGREQREVMEERDGIKSKYNELMKVHNQMIELDMQKNEKTLRETNMRFDEIEDFADSINAYQQEVEVLRESNVLSQKQLKYEMQKLKDELRRQKEENERVNKVLQEERTRGQRSPRDRRERSGFKEARPREYANNNNNNDDLLNLSKGELAKYARGLQESYAFLEVKHKEQVKHNEVLQGELRTLGESSKEEIERFNEAFSEAFDGVRRTHTTSIPRHSDEATRENFSTERERRFKRKSSEKYFGKRDRLRQELRKDLDEIADIGRTPNHKRSRSRSVRFSPTPEIMIDTKPFLKTKELRENGVTSTRSQKEFVRDLWSLKEMVNQNIPVKKTKERKEKEGKSKKILSETENFVSVKTSREKSHVKSRETLGLKPTIKGTKDKEKEVVKKRKKIGNL